MSGNQYLFVVGVVVLVCSLPAAYGLGTAPTPNLSQFLGVKAPANTLCYQTTIPKGTRTPVTVANPTPAAAITYIQAVADRFNKAGFNMRIVSGALGAVGTIPITISGKAILPYNIMVEYWC
ncbi:hypothetical protein pipiens_006134 [Culex pipiens pipiens]|uniref:Uncharacterized protein n=1 Tax=Culex pipiens pipiens TaxID=38569 RepID=A0ABD1DS91_CULPP|nr:uncharacterized protein LOC120415731 [Culex pipiens pallens]